MRCATALGIILLTIVPATALGQGTSSEMDKAVQEFKIQTRNLGLRADSPRKAKKTRSGASSWHGRVFWNFRNDFLDAVPHEVTQTGGDKGILRRNQWGFNVSGPVVIPKLYDGGTATFFSLSYEGMRESIGRSYLVTLPTIPERSGDFSQVVDKAGEPLPIYDPQSTRLNPDFDPTQVVSPDNLQYLRELFPGNRIPSSRLDPVATDAIRYYPEPNVNIGPFNQNNYSTYSPEVNTANGMRGKLDHSIRDRHRLTFSFSFSNGLAGPAKYFDTIANPGRPDQENRSRGGSITHTFTISPNKINTFRFSTWTSTSENVTETDGGSAPFPIYSFRPYLPMGRRYPISRTAITYYEIADGFSIHQGKHSLRINGEWGWRQFNSYWPKYPSGYFQFSDGLTGLPGIVNTGHPFSSFLLGLARFAEASVVEHPSYFRAERGEVQIRDEWELRDGLTVSLRLTLPISTPRIEKYNRQSTVDLNIINPENDKPGALIFAGRNGHGRAFQPNRFRLEPSVSVAWSPFEGAKTIIRARYRRSYGSIPLYSGQWGTQGFNGTPTYISQNSQLEPAVILRDGLPPPEHPLPDLRPDAANNTIADLIDQSSLQPTYDSARVSVERQLPGSFMVSIGADYRRGEHMLTGNSGANPNAIPLDNLQYRDLLNDETFNRSVRPYPQFQRFNLSGLYPAGSYKRTEGYVRVEKRTSQGLSLRMNYEFSKQMDDYTGYGGLQDYYHRYKEWAPTPWNDPHQLSLSYMYELPFGPSKALLTANDWRRYFVEGWAISGTSSYSSGTPLRLRAEFNNTGHVVDVLYVNQVPEVEAHVENPSPERWFNPDAFVNPPDFTIGNVSRSHPDLFNPIRQNHDLSVTKRFSIDSSRAVELMATAFNFLNHANWNQPDTRIGSKESPNLNAGRIIGSRGGRVIQLGLRFTF